MSRSRTHIKNVEVIHSNSPSRLHENLPRSLPPLKIFMDPHNLRERIYVMNPDVDLVLCDGIKKLSAPLLKLLRRADISHQRTLARPHKS